MNKINQLLQQFQQLLQLGTQQRMQLCSVAYTIMDSPETPSALKEEILYKALFLCPDDGGLYYKAAQLYGANNSLKALTWHKMGYKIDPTHTENTIALCVGLYENGYGNELLDLNKGGQLNIYINDPRFLGAYARANFQNVQYANGVVYLQKLIEIYSAKPAVLPVDKIAKWQNYHDLGYIYNSLGQIDESIKCIQKATDLAIKFNLELPKQLLSFSNLLMYHCYKHQTNDEVYTLSQKINSYYPDKQTFNFSKRLRGKKIRLGYLSSDFTYHPVANFLIPILENHTDAFDIFLFSNNANVAPIFSKWKVIMINTLSDYEAAKLVYSTNIDILVDLNGHTVGNRLGVFAQNPAPVQITYLGYPNTTGLKSIKYRLTDKITNPPNSSEKHSEALVILPKCFLLYKNIVANKQKGTENLVNGRPLILGAINKESKNSTDVLSTWAKILKECTNTRLLIKLATYDNKEERLKYYMTNLDTSVDRLILVNRLTDSEYDNIFSKIDILLDTYPYSGTTTTCNALFNSVPVVTLYNPNNHCHSVSSSILINAGLPELVAHTSEEYVEIVKRLMDVDIINTYKRTVCTKFLNLMNPCEFIKSYESTLAALY